MFRRVYAKRGCTEVDHKTYKRRVAQGIYPTPATALGYTERQLAEYDEFIHRPIEVAATRGRGNAITRTLKKLL